jgi:hypothetical protein
MPGEAVLVPNSNPASGQRVLNGIRWWLFLTGLFMATTVTPDTLRSYHRWHSLSGADAATIDFWRTNFYLDVVRIVIELAVAIAIFIFLKPRSQSGVGTESVR